MTNPEHLMPDQELQSALRSIQPEPPIQEVDWETLRSSIVARAELPLARRRGRSTRLAHWTRPLVPLAAAASIAVAVWFNGFVSEQTNGAPMAESPQLPPPFISAEDLFHADLTDQEFQFLVSGRGNSEALLLVAVGGS
jgi:hypothetical protein